MLDGYFRVIYLPNLLVPWFLITSYLYYDRNVSIISDDLFDWICLELNRLWNIIDHPHKNLIDRGQLNAGTGYYLNMKTLPAIIKGAAGHLQQMAELQNEKLAYSHGSW